MQALSEVHFHIWRKISSAQNIPTAQEIWEVTLNSLHNLTAMQHS